MIQRFIFQSEHFRQQEKYFVQEVIPMTTESHHPPWLPVLNTTYIYLYAAAWFLSFFIWFSSQVELLVPTMDLA